VASAWVNSASYQSAPVKLTRHPNAPPVKASSVFYAPRIHGDDSPGHFQSRVQPSGRKPNTPLRLKDSCVDGRSLSRYESSGAQQIKPTVDARLSGSRNTALEINAQQPCGTIYAPRPYEANRARPALRPAGSQASARKSLIHISAAAGATVPCETLCRLSGHLASRKRCSGAIIPLACQT